MNQSHQAKSKAAIEYLWRLRGRGLYLVATPSPADLFALEGSAPRPWSEVLNKVPNSWIPMQWWRSLRDDAPILSSLEWLRSLGHQIVGAPTVERLYVVEANQVVPPRDYLLEYLSGAVPSATIAAHLDAHIESSGRSATEAAAAAQQA